MGVFSTAELPVVSVVAALLPTSGCGGDTILP